MLDLRRIAAPSGAARLALAAVLTFLCAWTITASPAHAAAGGELAAFGDFGFGDDQFAGGGPVAVDPTDANSIYVADLDSSFQPRLRKLAADGTRLATAAPSDANPSGSGHLYVVGLAVDGANDRVYVLLDADDHGTAQAREILVYSTVPQGGALVAPAGTPSGVLVDFRTLGASAGAVDYATGVAVDPGTGAVVVLGVDDSGAADPSGVLQYVTAAGALSTRVTGLGAGPDPGGAVANPAGLAIAPDGAVYVASLHNPDVPSERVGQIYRLPRGGGAPTLVAGDGNEPQLTPGFVNGLGVGSPIGLSSDGATVYLAEGNATEGRVRGYTTATGVQAVLYGGGTDSCNLKNYYAATGVAAGSGDVVVATSMNVTGDPGATVHVFGPGGTGCPRPQALFTVNGSGDGTITVTKGQSVAFDAGPSLLLGSVPSRVDWDFDGSGAFATQVTGAPAALTTTTKFLHPGTFQVGVKIHTDGAPPVLDPVFHQVTVVAPVPTASFTVSNRTPAAGASVTFDASAAADPAGSPTGGLSHDLAKYRWDFGDGSAPLETTTATASHAFANAGTAAVARTVKLSVVSHDDVASGTVQQAITVAGTPAGPGPGPGTQPQPSPQPQPTPQPKPKATPPSPAVTAGGVDAKGAVSLKVVCPAGGATCAGKVVLTIKVKSKANGKTKTTTLTLGTATFSVAAGKSKAVTLKLSAAGRALLKKQKKLSATAAVSVTAGGQTQTKSKTLTLKAAAKKK